MDKRLNCNFLSSFSIISCIQTLTVYMYILFLTHHASSIEYASYTSLTYIIDFTVAISLFGFNLLILREHESYISNNILSITLISFILTCIVFLFWLLTIHQQYTLETLLCFLLIVMQYLYQIGYTIQIKFQQNTTALYNAIINFTFTLLGLYGLTYFNALSCQNVLIVRIAQLCIFSLICYQASKKYIPALNRVSTKTIRSSFKAALPIGGGAILGTIILFVDKFIVTTLSYEDVATYSIARLEIPFIGIFIANLSLVFMPSIKDSFCNKNMNDVIIRIRELFTYGWYLNVIFFTLLFCNAEFIITTLYSESYAASVPLFKILICTYLLKIFPYTNILVALGLEKIIVPRLFIEMIIQIVASFALLNIWGITGLASCAVLVLAFWSIPYNIYFIKKAINTSISNFVPFSTMIYFFFKCFIPSLLITYYVNEISQPIFGALASLCVVLIINSKEIIYVYKHTK